MTLMELMDTEMKLASVREERLFELGVSQIIMINEKINEISKYTSLYFKLCEAYYEKIKDDENAEELLQKYSNKLRSEEIDVDVSKFSQFLD